MRRHSVRSLYSITSFFLSNKIYLFDCKMLRLSCTEKIFALSGQALILVPLTGMEQKFECSTFCNHAARRIQYDQRIERLTIYNIQ